MMIWKDAEIKSIISVYLIFILWIFFSLIYIVLINFFCQSNIHFLSVKIFSLFAIKIVATALPIKLVRARASLIILSTPSSNASPSTGITFTAESLDASTIKQLPVTPAALLKVIIKIRMTVNICAADKSTLKTWD